MKDILINTLIALGIPIACFFVVVLLRAIFWEPFVLYQAQQKEIEELKAEIRRLKGDK